MPAQPETQQDILAAALAAFTAADIPPDDDGWDPGRGRGGRAAARRSWPAWVGQDLAELLAARSTAGRRDRAGRVPAAGRVGRGWGLTDGGVLDTLPAGAGAGRVHRRRGCAGAGVLE